MNTTRYMNFFFCTQDLRDKTTAMWQDVEGLCTNLTLSEEEDRCRWMFNLEVNEGWMHVILSCDI